MNTKTIRIFLLVLGLITSIAIANSQSTVHSSIDQLLEEATLAKEKDFKACLKLSQAVIHEADRLHLPDYKSKAQLLICSMYHCGLPYDTLFQTCQEALGYFEEEKDFENLAWAYDYIGIVTDIRGDRQKALEYFSKGLELFRSLGLKVGEGYCLNDMGVTYGISGDYVKALDFYLQALTIFEELSNFDGLARTYTCLGYHSKKQFDKGRVEEYFEKAIAASEKTTNLFWKTIAISGYAKYLRESKKPEKALLFSEQAIIYSDSINSDYLRINAYVNHCYLLKTLKEAEAAKSLALETIVLMDRLKRYQSKGDLLNLLSTIYLEANQYDQAYSTLTLVAEDQKTTNKILAENYELWSVFYEKQADYKKALAYKDKHIILKDSLERIEKTVALATIENSYELGRKQTQIDFLNQQNVLQKELLENRRNLLALLLILIFIVFAIFIFAYRQKQSLNQILEVKVEERTNDLTVLNSKLEKSNEELKRFAYIASHDLKEPLRNISGFLHLIEKRKNNLSEESAAEFISIAKNNAIQMHELIEDVLEYSQLNESEEGDRLVNLNAIVQQIVVHNNLNLPKKVDYRIAELPQLKVLASDMNRLFHNLIENGIKYNESKVPTIEIDCEENANEYCIFIKDNGIGIDQAYFDKIFEMFRRLHDRGKYQGSGIGLASCKKIIEKYKGGIYVQSKIGKGTTFILTFPK